MKINSLLTSFYFSLDLICFFLSIFLLLCFLMFLLSVLSLLLLFVLFCFEMQSNESVCIFIRV